jgi:hypothetical protein
MGFSIDREPPPGRVTLRIINRLRLLYLCHFSKPAADRLVYRAIRRWHPQKIVELGLGDGQRALRMMELARQSAADAEVQYVGMDLFEARPESDGPKLSLKTAHQMLRGTGGKVQLVPGNPSDGLIRMANSLGKVDLLIVPAELDSSSHARLWFFVPRMLHERSLVFVEGLSSDGQPCLHLKSRHEINELASIGQQRRAA